MHSKHWWEPRQLVFPLVIGATFILVLGPLVDPDLFWHLANGRWMLSTHTIPRTDPFSFTMSGKEWICHEWLTEIVMYSIYRGLGPVALMIAWAAVIAAAFGLVLLRCRTWPYLGAICTLLAVLASAPILGVRPQMISLLLASLTLYIVESGVTLWTLVPISAVWANLHGGFFTGAALIGAYALGEAIDTLILHTQNQADGKRHIKQLTLTALGMAVASLLNPYGVKLILYPFQTLASGAMRLHITEWLSPDFHKLAFQPLALFLLALVASLAFSPKRPSTTHLLMLLGSLYAALNSARHIPLFTLVAAPVLSEQLASVLPGRWAFQRVTNSGKAATSGMPAGSFLPRQQQKRFGIFFALVIVATLALGIVWRVRAVVAYNEAAQRSSYPVAATDALRQVDAAGNLFNAYNWGGYLIWRGEKVFIDGRADLYGDAFFNQYSQLYYGQTRAADAFQRYDIRRVLIEAHSALATFLDGDSRWQRVYQDDQAVLFVRVEAR